MLNARIRIYPCGAHLVGQLWVAVSGTGVAGRDWLGNPYGRAVGIAGASSADGAPLVQFSTEHVSNQYWAWKPLPA